MYMFYIFNRYSHPNKQKKIHDHFHEILHYRIIKLPWSSHNYIEWKDQIHDIMLDLRNYFRDMKRNKRLLGLVQLSNSLFIYRWIISGQDRLVLLELFTICFLSILSCKVHYTVITITTIEKISTRISF